MLTIEDCIAMSTLTPDEIEAIAEHEHIPEIVAAELGSYMMTREDGTACLHRFILEDIETAQRHGHTAHAAKLKLVLQHFAETYGGARVC